MLVGNCRSQILDVPRRRKIAHSNGKGQEMLEKLVKTDIILC